MLQVDICKLDNIHSLGGMGILRKARSYSDLEAQSIHFLWKSSEDGHLAEPLPKRRINSLEDLKALESESGREQPAKNNFQK
jgi:hypothetical protein